MLPELARGDAKQRVWRFSHAEFVPVFKTAAASIGLPSLVPLQARHSGASIDSAGKHRSQPEIQRRGRWKTLASVLRYERHAQLAKSAQSLSAR